MAIQPGSENCALPGFSGAAPFSVPSLLDRSVPPRHAQCPT